MKRKFFNFRVLWLLIPLLSLLTSSAWGATTTLAGWTFTSSSYPSNKTNFTATTGTMTTNSTFYLNGSGSTWNTGTGKGYAFTSVTSITITLTLNQAAPSGTAITLAADAFYNKDSNKPVGSYGITVKVGSGSASTTGVGTTTWTLSNSSDNKSTTYTTQSALNSGTAIQFILTASGSSGSGQAYFNNVTIKATTYSVTYQGNGNTSGSVPTDNTKYLSGATVTVKTNSGNLAKTNYNFVGWNENSWGTGASYSATAPLGTFAITSDKTLYAEWESSASCSSNATVTAGSLKGSNSRNLFS